MSCSRLSRPRAKISEKETPGLANEILRRRRAREASVRPSALVLADHADQNSW